MTVWPFKRKEAALGTVRDPLRKEYEKGFRWGLSSQAFEEGMDDARMGVPMRRAFEDWRQAEYEMGYVATKEVAEAGREMEKRAATPEHRAWAEGNEDARAGKPNRFEAPK